VHFVKKTEQPTPVTAGAFVRAVLESLAFKYRQVILDLERLTREPIRQIRIIGGGSKNRLLNQFTADATGRRVLAGPPESHCAWQHRNAAAATGVASSLSEVARLWIGLTRPKYSNHGKRTSGSGTSRDSSSIRRWFYA